MSLKKNFHDARLDARPDTRSDGRWSALLPPPAYRPACRRLVLGALAWVVATSLLAGAAAFRVAQVPRSPVSPAPLLALAVTLVSAAAALGLIAVVVLAAVRILGRLKRDAAGRRDLPDAVCALAAAAVFLAAAMPVLRYLPVPLAAEHGWVYIPLIGKPALIHVTPLLLLLGAEAGLSLWWIVEERGWPWYLVRAATGIFWCVFLVTVIAGPDPLRGDPLEWAARLGMPTIHPAWMSLAPRVMQPWWPAFRVGLAGAALFTLLGSFEEVRAALRLRRTGD